MKKVYKLLAAAIVALAPMAAMAQAATQPVALWGKLVSAPQKTGMGYDLAVASDGALYSLTSAGTMTDAEEIKFGTEVIGHGTTNSTTSGNQNLVLIKTDGNGNRLWSAYSTIGDLYSGGGWLAATNDGGVMMVVKFRHSDGRTEKPAFVDGTGKTTELDWAANDNGRFYRMVMVRFSKDGAIEWTRMADIDTTPQKKATTYSKITPDGFDVYTAKMDGNQNLYVGGRFRMPITFQKADGSKVTLTPCNVKDWTGDPQTQNGDLFIAKFDASGNYLKSLVSTDSASYTAIKNVRIANDKLYFEGYFQGRTMNGAINPVKLGGIDLGLKNANTALLVGVADLDLNVLNAKTFASEVSGSVYQTTALDVIDNNIYLTGKTKCKLDLASGTMDASNTTRDGYLIKLNSDLEPQGSALNGKNQSGFMGVVADRNDNDNIYVLGHNLMSNLFMKKYDRNTLAYKDVEWNLTDNASAILPMVASNDTLYALSRVRGTVKFIGGEISLSSSSFNALVAAFKLPVHTTTAIETVADCNDINVTATRGAINITTATQTTVNVYNITGALVASVKTGEGTTTVELPAGLYIAAGKKLIVR